MIYLQFILTMCNFGHHVLWYHPSKQPSPMNRVASCRFCARSIGGWLSSMYCVLKPSRAIARRSTPRTSPPSCWEKATRTTPCSRAETSVRILHIYTYIIQHYTESNENMFWLGYIRNDFVPFERPGFVDTQCYNGQKKGDHADRFWLTRGRIGPFKRCETTSLYWVK